MKYIILTYNYLTLIRTIKYINYKWGKENSVIIYLNIVSDLPSKIKNDYDIKEIACNCLHSKKTKIPLLIQSYFDSQNTWKCIKKELDSLVGTVILVLFKDNELLESTIIANIFRNYKNKVHIWLLEEGSGIYATATVPVRYPIIKKLLFSIFRISTYSLNQNPQGLHPYLEKVICSKPALFKNKRSSPDLIVEQMEKTFTPDINAYFLHSLACTKPSQKYNFAFLTQPFQDWKDHYDKLLMIHKTLLPEVFKILSCYGRTIIKLHPREHFDYSQYVNENIDIVEGIENNIPFECLLEFYGAPQIISMFSSTSINICSSKPSIYLGKLFSIPIMDSLFSEKFYQENNIISCASLKELEKIVSKTINER